MAQDVAPGHRGAVEPPADDHHPNVAGGAARAAVFGVSDGLVTNVSLILGVAAANPSPGVVRLAGLASLLAGAFSMAAGEYVSMAAQAELLEAQLAKERHELEHNAVAEREELAQIYQSRGLSRDLAVAVAQQLMSDPERALETHAREEMGIDPSQLSSPWWAAASSFATFSAGAAIPLLPWLFSSGSFATLLSITAAAVAAVGIGLLLSTFTGRSPVRSAGRQLLIAAGAAAITYLVGSSLGVAIS